jgi:hypothetical protein
MNEIALEEHKDLRLRRVSMVVRSPTTLVGRGKKSTCHLREPTTLRPENTGYSTTNPPHFDTPWGTVVGQRPTSYSTIGSP